MGKQKMAVEVVQTMTLGGREYVVLPKASFMKMVSTLGNAVETVATDAIAYAKESIGAALRLAREKAGLTQVELAKKLRKSQTLVSAAESGHMRVGGAYVRSVLKACGLPADWKP